MAVEAGQANDWDAEAYDRTAGIVTRLGGDVLDLLAPGPGMRVLDLGCGTGHLTAQIAAAGADVLGLDAAPSMIERARALYPHLRFEVARAEDFTLDAPVDAVFSNAALHWMRPPEAVVARVARALVPGGRFVAEMGGQGNVATVIAALRQALAEEGVLPAAQPDPWYFPGIAEYATLLERVGFEPTLMHLFDRPTPLDDCPGGAADWVRLFGGAFLDAVPPERRDASAARVADLVRPALYREGHWIADYRRLRFVAVRR
ncbi:MAG TPA: methyltransferase domain-containing protein [Chloroflexota bacterium]|jgi:trans-aconitate methyltransferase